MLKNENSVDNYPVYYGRKLFPVKGICEVLGKHKFFKCSGRVFVWEPPGLNMKMTACEDCFHRVWAGEN